MLAKRLHLRIVPVILLSLLISCQNSENAKPATEESSPAAASKIWSIDKANEWYAKQKWIVGANFIPSTAINQLEMWQKETFDTATISKELGWAASIGYNTMRVYLHHLAWEVDSTGFLDRMNTYLSISESKGIKTLFVLFDDCWNKEPKAGTQPAPKPGTHNSGWVQDPGDPFHKDSSIFPQLERYVKAVIGRFAKDQRILLWDLYNEPGNSGKKETTLPLLTNTFKWAREVSPEQPISAGLWDWSFEKLNQFQLENSDVITYHDYEEEPWHRRVLELLKANGRPMICTEYMARTRNSLFSTILPMLKEKNVGAINWGLVAGKTNTIYAWDTPIADGSEPKLWFHDVFRKDGTPYLKEDAELIKKLTGTTN